MGLDVFIVAIKDGETPPKLIGGAWKTTSDNEIMYWRKPYELMCVFDVLLSDDGVVVNSTTYPITVDKLEKIIELHDKWFVSKTEEPLIVNHEHVWNHAWVDDDMRVKRVNDLKLLLDYMKTNNTFEYLIHFWW